MPLRHFAYVGCVAYPKEVFIDADFLLLSQLIPLSSNFTIFKCKKIHLFWRLHISVALGSDRKCEFVSLSPFLGRIIVTIFLFPITEAHSANPRTARTNTGFRSVVKAKSDDKHDLVRHVGRSLQLDSPSLDREHCSRRVLGPAA